jgi:hypothetical protein
MAYSVTKHTDFTAALITFKMYCLTVHAYYVLMCVPKERYGFLHSYIPYTEFYPNRTVTERRKYINIIIIFIIIIIIINIKY